MVNEGWGVGGICDHVDLRGLSGYPYGAKKHRLSEFKSWLCRLLTLRSCVWFPFSKNGDVHNSYPSYVAVMWIK